MVPDIEILFPSVSINITKPSFLAIMLVVFHEWITEPFDENKIIVFI